MGAYKDYIDQLKSGLSGLVPFGGTIVTTASEFPSVLAAQIKGGNFVLPSLEVLADLPIEMLETGMSVVVREHERPNSSLHARTRYYLRSMPGQVISEIVDYQIFDYWAFENSSPAADTNAVETQYAPNYEGKKPYFLPSQISTEAYQAGYPTTALYEGENPSDIIWANEYDPLLNHTWFRQRIGTQPWGIPVAISSAGDYEQNQYIDVIFRWVLKGAGTPARPIQPDDYTQLPSGWLNTPGDNYDTDILTLDLYRSQALKSPYGQLKSDWETPILISSDPQLVRYGNTPGSSDFLNNTFWRGYYTPGLDTFMATRPNGGSTNWTITKIDQESGEFDDFVFKAFPIGTTPEALALVVPTLPVPFGGDSPNDCFDGPFEPDPDEVLYMSKATKTPDGSLKTPWSLWKRFDGLNSIQAIIEEGPGATFYQYRDSEGNLQDALATITLTPRLFSGQNELTTNISAYKWYRGNTLIVFNETTRKAINLGIELNDYHELAENLVDLILYPEAVDVSQQYKVGITHISRDTDYEDKIQIRDASDDGEAFVVDIKTPNGSIFKNQAGLYRFIAAFFKGGIEDNVDVIFSWSIRDSLGGYISGGIRNSGGDPLGSTDVIAAEVYVQGASIDQYATLEVVATFGEIERTFVITLVDVEDAVAVEALYWGTGSTYPGNPTDFAPRTLTKQQVLDLNIGYLDNAAGTWFRIERINGVWGGEIQMRSESARPNGGLSLTIYTNIEDGVNPVPTAPAVPGSGSIVPAGWTTAPTAFTGNQDITYVTSCLFLLRTDVAADPSVLTRDNYSPLGGYGTPKAFSANAVPPAVPGDKGWSPIIVLEPDGERRVLKLQEWTGGTGTPPPGAGGSSSYIGLTGLTSKAAAIDLRGPAGAPAASVRPQYVASAGGINSSLIPNFTLTPVNPWVHVRSLIIQNTHSEARWFLLRGVIGFQESTSDARIVTVRLLGGPGQVAFPVENSVWGTLTGTPGGTLWYNLSIANRQRIDINPSALSGLEVHQVSIQHTVLVPPGEYYTVALAARADINVSLRNLGMIEVIGL